MLPFCVWQPVSVPILHSCGCRRVGGGGGGGGGVVMLMRMHGSEKFFVLLVHRFCFATKTSDLATRTQP